MIAAAPNPRPAALTVNRGGIPAELRERPQWVCARSELRDGRWTKVPYQVSGAKAATDDPSTWGSFADIMAAYDAGGWDGIGYVFAADDPYVGVDIDKVRGDPDRESWALGIARRFGSYTEWSLSGTGIHIIGKGTMPDVGEAAQKGRNDRKKGLEAYSRLRFFTFTGGVVDDTSTRVVPCQEALDWLLANEFTAQASERASVRLVGGTATRVADDDRARLEKMFNGKRGAELRTLWSGGSKNLDPGGKPDTSGDDQSVMNALAFWLDRDAGRMASAFLSSGRNRPKLHERHAADGSTYLEMTIGTAIAGCAQSYGDLMARRTEAPATVAASTVADPEATEDVTELRAEVLRLRRALIDQSDKVDELAGVIQVQQTVVARERERANELDRRAKETRDLLRNPHLPPTDKLVFLATTWRVESGVSRGQEEIKIVYPELAEAAGVSTSTVGRVLRRHTTDDDKPTDNPDAPLAKRTVTEWRAVDGVGMQPTSSVYLRPKGEGSILASAATYVPPEQRKHGGTRLPRCPEHPTADLVIRSTTHCASCDRQLGEPTESLRCQLDSVGDTPPAVDVPVLKGRQLDSVEAADARARAVVGIETAADRLRKQDAAVETLDELAPRRPQAAEAIPLGRAPDPWKTIAPPEPAPNDAGESLGRIGMTRANETNGHAPLTAPVHGVTSLPWGSPAPTSPKSKPWRCPECRASERKVRPDGSSRCPRGHVSHESAEAAG